MYMAFGALIMVIFCSSGKTLKCGPKINFIPGYLAAFMGVDGEYTQSYWDKSSLSKSDI
jgi:hypothetical protein